MTGIARVLAVAFLIASLPCAALAQDRAMLYPGEGISLNGKAISINSTVFSGDSIQTGKGAAQIVGHGVSTYIEPGSLLTYGSPMQLGCGSITVTGQATLKGAGETITATSPAAKFQVINRGGTLLVSVQSGAVNLSGAGNKTLEAGQSANRTGSTSCPGALGVPAVAATHAKAYVLGAVAAAGGVAGAILASRGGESKSASPTRP